MGQTERLARDAAGGPRTGAARATSGQEFYELLRDGLHRSLDGIEGRLRELQEPHRERVSLLAARNLLRGARNCLVRAERVSRSAGEPPPPA